jgi:hypothetical protein
MKHFIRATHGGVTYSTQSAKLLCVFNVEEKGHPSYLRAKLYRTPHSGRYFLAGEGGPLTVFARSTTGIVPVPDDIAESLIADRLSPSRKADRKLAEGGSPSIIQGDVYDN